MEVKVSKDIKTVGIFNNGKTDVQLKFNKNAFDQNESAKILANIDNTHCEKDINEIEVRIVRYLHCKNRKTSTLKYNETLVKRVYYD
eukprot:CAMPEP_0170560668 /NCGR_PEP_ID=MMETSP0211-20121228/50263_1 /TAXON_ID=311385 /ORGANISM="Pseudokeronopsis sp., Strain OXSARD2" /LENGTH=86 /DNA_ID=CAMNT_0010875159 /DNA_START=482 /DNA_END=742 /DNA_ORIENTATION=+